MRLVCEARHRLMTQILHTRFSSQLDVIPSAAGLHISALAVDSSPDRIDAVVRRAAREGVGCLPLSLWGLKREPSPGLVLGYGAIATDRIEAGLDRPQPGMKAGGGG